MGGIFGKPNRTPQPPPPGINHASVTEKDKAMLELKVSRDKLKKIRRKNETESIKLRDQARQLVQLKQNQRALLVLKLKKHKDQAVDNIDAQLLSVLRMIEDIEWESTNIQVMKALQTGNAALHQLHEEMSIDDVTKLLDDTNEAIEVENEINRLLAGQSELFDESELLLELDQLSVDSISSPKVSLPDLPVAPTHEIKLQENPISPGEEIMDKKKKETQRTLIGV